MQGNENTRYSVGVPIRMPLTGARHFLEVVLFFVLFLLCFVLLNWSSSRCLLHDFFPLAFLSFVYLQLSLSFHLFSIFYRCIVQNRISVIKNAHGVGVMAGQINLQLGPSTFHIGSDWFSYHQPGTVYLEGSGPWLPAPCVGDLAPGSWPLPLAWLSPDCCRCLGSEAADGTLLTLSLSNTAIQIIRKS